VPREVSSFHYIYPRNLLQLREEHTARVSSFHYDYRKYFAFVCCRDENKSKTKIARFRRKNFSSTPSASMKVYANGISLEHTYARALAESGIFLQQWFIYEAVGSNLVCRKVIKKLDSHRSLWASWDMATIYATMRDLRGRTSWKPNTRAKVLHFFDDPFRIDRSEGVKTCLRRQIIDGIQKPWWWIIDDGIFSFDQSIFTGIVRKNF